MKKISVLFFPLLIFPFLTYGGYSISGKINLSKEWQSTIYLAAIPSIDDLHHASPSLVVNTAPIMKDGSFTITGSDLPEEYMIYRLYVAIEGTSSYLYIGGMRQNFIHLILNNESDLSIGVSPGVEPFKNYKVSGSDQSQQLAEFKTLLSSLRSLEDYDFRSSTKEIFTRDKVNNAILDFINSLEFPLVKLVASYHLADVTANSEMTDRIDSLHTTLEQQLSGTSSYGLPSQLSEIRGDGCMQWLAIVLGVICLLLIFATGMLWYQYSRLKEAVASQITPSQVLTDKELEIYSLLLENLSNKEIARKLFIEVSTVKTHVYHIYQKLGVSNRRELRGRPSIYRS